MTEQNNLQKCFGDLRSLVEQQSRDVGWGQQIVDLVVYFNDKHPELYNEQWLPYLKQHAQNWSGVSFVFSSIEQFELFCGNRSGGREDVLRRA